MQKNKLFTGSIKHVGNQRVLESGSLITISNEPLKFVFDENFIVHIEFEDEDTQKFKPEISSRHENNTLIIVLKNFINSLPTANTSPLKIGTLDHKVVYFNFMVCSAGIHPRISKLVSYTWLLGEVENDSK